MVFCHCQHISDHDIHADKLIASIPFRVGHPNLQKLDPLRIGQTPKETLECDLAAEHGARERYT